LSWCIGIRAIESMKLKNNSVPTMIARVVLREVIKRPKVKKQFLESKMLMWRE
jgi:hypothetical protein